MKKWFGSLAGRHKTVLRSMLAFVLVLVVADVAFEINNSSKVEVVKVRHVFEEETAPKEKMAEQEPSMPEIVEVKVQKETVPEVAAPVVPAPKPELAPVPEPKAEPEPASPKLKPQPEAEMAQKEVMPPEPVANEPTPEVGVEPVPESTPVLTEPETLPEPEPETVTPRSEPEPLVALLGKKKIKAPETTGTRDFEISDELRKLVGAKTEPTPAVSLSSKIEKSNPKKQQTTFKGMVVSESEVEVDSIQYNELFKSWRNAGMEDDGRKQLSFRVQNLRRNYQLLQMKPVVVRGSRYFDLLNGAPMPDRMLEEYSSLQLVVEKPWQEWQPELQRLGVRVGDDFNVRYLLYGSIDRAMQARVNRSFDCAMEQGLVAAETSPADVEIIGRVFQVSRTGGGRFGVFVPRTLKTKGTQVAVSGACFSGSADVQMLMDAGVVQ
jgi:hypothetical protein